MMLFPSPIQIWELVLTFERGMCSHKHVGVN